MQIINKEKEFIYIESFWSGRKRILYKDEECFKNENGNFVYKEGTEEEVEIIIKGSYLTGVTCNIGEDNFTLVKKIQIYEWIMSLAFFSFIFYKGLIGALVGALFAITNLICIRGIKSIVGKIVCSIVLALMCFALCYVLALVIKIEYEVE